MIWYSDAQLRAWAEMNRGQFDPVVVDTADNQKITATVTVDGVETSYNVGDTVTDLAYKDGEETKTVSGTIKYITFKCDNVTPVSTKDPVDNFSKDVTVESFMIETEDGNVTVNIADLAGTEVTSIATAVVVVGDQEIKVSDVLSNLKVKGIDGVSEDKYLVKAYSYRQSDAVEVYIAGLVVSTFGTDSTAMVLPVNSIVSFTKCEGAISTLTDSLIEISQALNESADGVLYAALGSDVTIPVRPDGKITTTMINRGQELHIDLAGHKLSTQAYAFYVNGGELFISDSTGEGKIECTIPNKAYPAIQINAGGKCTMEGGNIDTSNVDLSDGKYNWIYGAVCSGDGVFNMTGGTMKLGGAAGISITNGTATGQGAIFNISGDSVIEGGETGVYLADNKSVNVSGNAVINNGVLMRMGDLNVSENAVINSQKKGSVIEPLGSLVTFSGCTSHNAAILALTGIYGSSLGNDLNINIEKPANVNGKIDNAIDIATINTKYNQIVNVNIENSEDVKFTNKLWNIYNHDQLAEMVAEQGKTLAPETTKTTLTITVDGKEVFAN